MSEPQVRRPFTLAATLLAVALARPVSAACFWAGVGLAAAGAALRLWAAGHIEKDRRLATEGPYALVRHPLYLGSGLLLAGACFCVADPARWTNSAAVAVLAALAFGRLYERTLADEEAHLGRVFGPDYACYADEVPRLLPAPSRLRPALGTSRWRWPRVRANGELATLAASFGVALLLGLKMDGR